MCRSRFATPTIATKPHMWRVSTHIPATFSEPIFARIFWISSASLCFSRSSSVCARTLANAADTVNTPSTSTRQIAVSIAVLPIARAAP